MITWRNLSIALWLIVALLFAFAIFAPLLSAAPSRMLRQPSDIVAVTGNVSDVALAKSEASGPFAGVTLVSGITRAQFSASASVASREKISLLHCQWSAAPSLRRTTQLAAGPGPVSSGVGFGSSSDESNTGEHRRPTQPAAWSFIHHPNDGDQAAPCRSKASSATEAALQANGMGVSPFAALEAHAA